MSKGLAGFVAGWLVFFLITAVLAADKTVSDYIAAGKEFFNATDYDAAIDSFTAALKLEPTSIEALLNRGNAYCRRGYYDKAIDDYTEVIRLDPQNGKAYNNRAIAHWFNDETAPSEADSAKAEALGITVNNEAWQALRGYRDASPVPSANVSPQESQGSLSEAVPEKRQMSQGKQP